MGETVIETGLLIIREFVPEDLEALYRIYESADTRFLQPLSEDREEELEKLKSYIQYVYGFYGFGLWAVCLKETGALIGRCGLQVMFIGDEGEYEMGYMISGAYQGMGYGGEAVRAILEYAGEELEAPRVVLRIDSGNTASLRFAERLGFHKSDRILENERSTFLYIYEL